MTYVPMLLSSLLDKGALRNSTSSFLEILKKTWQCVPGPDGANVFNYYRTLYRFEPRVGLCVSGVKDPEWYYT